MRSWHSSSFAPLAVVALIAAGYSGNRAGNRRCAWAVEQLPAAGGGIVRDKLRVIDRDGSWKIRRRAGAAHGAPILEQVEWGDARWTCSAEDVPLIVADSDSARALTPDRVLP